MQARAIVSRRIVCLLATAICAAGALAYVASDFIDKAQAQTTVMNVKRAKAKALKSTRADCKQQANLYTVFKHGAYRCVKTEVTMCWRKDLYTPNTALCLADFHLEDRLMPEIQWVCSITQVVDYNRGRYKVQKHSVDDYYCHTENGIPD
jgi:hypothetical protein